MNVRHGVDIEAITSVRDLLAISKRARSRVFTSREIEDCERVPDACRHYAGRFCAKEALFKALGRGWQGMGWKEAEVRVDNAGAPRFVLHGTLRAAAEALRVQSISLSISHTPEFAMASVILLLRADTVHQFVRPLTAVPRRRR